VDEAPYLITGERILTGLIGGRCTSAADVVAELHTLVGRELGERTERI
jgi:hypothetical protein